MAYYTGSYYSGGYYQGGILSGIGNFIKKALPIAAGFVPGVGGAAARLLGGARTAIRAAPIASVATAFQAGRGGGSIGTGMIPVPGLKGLGQRLIPGGATGYYMPRRRRMNVTNVRALRRAGRRVKGFLKLASRLGALPVNRGKGKTLFKRKRR